MFETVNVYGNNLFIDNIQIDGTLIGVEESTSSTATFTVYPNPTNGKVFTDLKDMNGSAEVSVFRIDGTVVRQRSVTGSQTVSFDLNDLPSGLYFIEVRANGQQYTEKIILQ
jgi:hypothetical protein